MSHWSSSNTSNRTRLARALAAETGVGYQQCLRVVAGVADAGLLPPFGADTMEASVQALTPLVMVQPVKGHRRARFKHKTHPVVASEFLADVPGLSSPLVVDGPPLVRFSPHDAITANRPPGVALTGMPGSGKTFWAFSMVHQMVTAGGHVVYIDPKGDAAAMVRAPGLEGATVMDLRRAEDGLLNPFVLARDAREGALLAFETVRMLAGDSLSAAREAALIQSLNEVAGEPHPSLDRVVDRLLAHTDEEPRGLGLMLDVLRKMSFARLCFGAGTGSQVTAAAGLTVLTLVGLPLASRQMRPEDYSYENRLAMSVMYLLPRFAHQMMTSLDPAMPKAVVIDEAWCITTTRPGAQMVAEFGRLSRSHTTALLLITQDPGDLAKGSIPNLLSTVFAFRSTVHHEVDAALGLLDLDVHDESRSVVRDLRNGECLMRDVQGQVTRVQISIENRDLVEALTRV